MVTGLKSSRPLGSTPGNGRPGLRRPLRSSRNCGPDRRRSFAAGFTGSPRSALGSPPSAAPPAHLGGGQRGPGGGPCRAAGVALGYQSPRLAGDGPVPAGVLPGSPGPDGPPRAGRPAHYPGGGRQVPAGERLGADRPLPLAEVSGLRGMGAGPGSAGGEDFGLFYRRWLATGSSSGRPRSVSVRSVATGRNLG